MTSKTEFVVGSRVSNLAMTQTRWVISRLSTAHPSIDFTIKPFQSEGDRRLEARIGDIGGKGVFTQELTQALNSGEIDAAVHSLKDLPVDAEEASIILYPERADARDAWIGRDRKPFDSLVEGGRVGTSSLRRAAQIKRRFPKVEIVPIRGNVQTRVNKVETESLQGVLLAAAGLDRLGMAEVITSRLEPEVMLPSPGQGILGVECLRKGSAQDLLQIIADEQATYQAAAERAFLAALQGSCLLPAGAHSVLNGTQITLATLLASPDGTDVVERSGHAPVSEAAALGIRLAEETLESGGRAIKAGLE